eukprot:5986316-Prymnesium_polylepis.2
MTNANLVRVSQLLLFFLMFAHWLGGHTPIAPCRLPHHPFGARTCSREHLTAPSLRARPTCRLALVYDCREALGAQHPDAAAR